jgi:DNA-binding NarL/FixJ family response regulator
MVMTLEAPLAHRSSKLGTSAPYGSFGSRTKEPCRVSVEILAARGIERCAIEAILADQGFVPVRSLGAHLRADVLIMREGAGMHTRVICESLSAADRGSIRILTLCDSVERIAAAINAGADGAISMASAPGQLADAIRDVAAGNAVIPCEALALLVAGTGRQPDLDPLEVAVLDELADGATDAMIGRSCNLTSSVVRDIVGDLLRKFRVRGRVEIVIEAHHLGLLL